MAWLVAVPKWRNVVHLTDLLACFNTMALGVASSDGL